MTAARKVISDEPYSVHPNPCDMCKVDHSWSVVAPNGDVVTVERDRVAAWALAERMNSAYLVGFEDGVRGFAAVTR